MVLVSICFFDGKTVDRKAEQLDKKLETLYSLAEEESDNLLFAVEDTEAYWKKNELFFALATNHRLTDELDENILMLKYFADINDKEHILTKIGECRSLVEVIVLDDNFAWHNIF